MSDTNEQPAVKDPSSAHPVASVWRPTLQKVVRALANGDFGLAGGVAGVTPPSPRAAEQIRRYLEEYPETLTELPEGTWRTSVAQWMETHWEVLVDLWAVEAGPSDLVLFVRVFEAGDEFRFEIDSVHVP